MSNMWSNSDTNIGIEWARKRIEKLAKAHCIWIRDVYYEQPQFQCIPWPMARVNGLLQPIAEFISFFNPSFAEGMMVNACKWLETTEGIRCLDTISKDYFKEGEEGFNFPVDASVKNDENFFREKIDELVNWFPHLQDVPNE